MVSASVTTSSEAWAVHTQVLFAHVRPLVSYGVTCSETLPMRKLPTGEPYARKPHVRFAGRGGESLPDPYRRKPAVRRSPYFNGEISVGSQMPLRITAR